MDNDLATFEAHSSLYKLLRPPSGLYYPLAHARSLRSLPHGSTTMMHGNKAPIELEKGWQYMEASSWGMATGSLVHSVNETVLVSAIFSLLLAA